MQHKKTIIRIPAVASVGKTQKKPLVIRRSWDMSADIVRAGEEREDAAIGMHMRGAGEVSLLRCAAYGMLAVGAVSAVCLIRNACTAMYYRRKYAKHYREKIARSEQKREHAEYKKKSAHNSIPQEACRTCANSGESKKFFRKASV